MSKVFLFMMTSLDGYIEGPKHDLSWHTVDAEFSKFAMEQLDEVETVVFGRRTYQLMESFWPTEQGRKDDYETAIRINKLPKVVFSKTLQKVTQTKQWENVTLLHDNITQEIEKLKKNASKDIAVLGSNNLCVTLLKLGLLDELRIMINPVVIGKGTPLFVGIKEKQKFALMKTREFHNGNVLLYYVVEK